MIIFKQKSLRITAIVLGIAMLLLCAFATGYYYGWSQLGRFQARTAVTTTARYVSDLDTLQMICPQGVAALKTIEAEINASIMMYVTSDDGGSLGINQIWMSKLDANRLSDLAKIVAKYRKTHPFENGDSKQFHKIIDSMAAKILSE